MSFKYEIGDTVKDIPSGVEGVIIGRAEYTYGIPNLYEVCITGSHVSIWLAELRIYLI